MDILHFAFSGALLGLAAGFSPGPLLALVVRETVRHNRRAGILVACAPLITDLPIILLSLLLINNLGDNRVVLGVISLAGAAFVAYLGMSSLTAHGRDLKPHARPPRSLWQGVLANLLSPHPYLFWITIGAPGTAKAYRVSAVAAILFVAAFYVCLIGAKITVAHLTDRSRRFLEGRAYHVVLRVLGLALLLFAVLLFREGLGLTGLNA